MENLAALLKKNISQVILFILIGAFVDFFFNGVLKITVAIIYLPTYLVIACTIGTWVSRGRWKHLIWVAVGAFAAGALLGHLILSDHGSKRTYEFAFVSMQPLQPSMVPAVTLQPSTGSQYLIVTGKQFSTVFANANSTLRVPVNIRVRTDYGCIKRFAIDTVSGIDVGTQAPTEQAAANQSTGDNDTSWTWRKDLQSTSQALGPGFEDQILPWCRYNFI